MGVACTALFSICPDIISSCTCTSLVNDQKLVQQPASEQWAAWSPLVGRGHGCRRWPPLPTRSPRHPRPGGPQQQLQGRPETAGPPQSAHCCAAVFLVPDWTLRTTPVDPLHPENIVHLACGHSNSLIAERNPFPLCFPSTTCNAQVPRCHTNQPDCPMRCRCQNPCDLHILHTFTECEFDRGV